MSDSWGLDEFNIWISSGCPVNTVVRELYLYNNHLTYLPESIGNLTSLVYLYLENNQLTSLPESIGNLTSLVYLNLENNQLTSLPESIGNLTSLIELHLDFWFRDIITNVNLLKKVTFGEEQVDTKPAREILY